MRAVIKFGGLLICISIMLSSCATKQPVLYPNAHLKVVGKGVARQDIEECIQLAKTSGASSKKAEKIAKRSAAGGVGGAATGAAIGAVTGNAGTKAAAGAAAGTTSGLFHGIFHSSDPDPIHRRFVEQCLSDKGYKTIGWR